MPKKILIIDDDEELCNEMADIFRDEGFSVNTAYNGLEGLERIRESFYDHIILDYRMPGMNGLEFLRFIKQNKIKSNIFIASGLPFIEKIIYNEKLMDLVISILPKPFPFETLLEKISSLKESGIHVKESKNDQTETNL